MPSLIVSSRYTTDSQILRQTAQELGWATLRLDGRQIPEWFEPPDEHIALFYTAPHAFEIAAQLSRTLLGCGPAWTVKLPQKFLRREIRQTTLAEALRIPSYSFVKHALSKSFPAAIYNASSLAEATSNIPTTALVHVGEPVEWSAEYRCFVSNGKIDAISPYRRHGNIVADHYDHLNATQAETDAAKCFANAVLASADIPYPPAFVLDIGMITGRDWAVVEFNECWASGIYACEPQSVLETLLRACVRTESMSTEVRRWDFEQHYFRACG